MRSRRGNSMSTPANSTRTRNTWLMSIVAIALWTGIGPLAFSQGSAPDCGPGGTTVYFGNGMANTLSTAYSGLRRTERMYQSRLQLSPGPLDSFALAFNPGHGSQVTIDGTQYTLDLVGLLESLDRALDQEVTPVILLRWLSGRAPVPAQAALVIARFVGRASSTPVLANHVASYNATLSAGNRVILVAHSQGNFFGIEAYSNIDGSRSDSFSMISVATPAATVARGGPYFTLDGDFISLAPGAPAANVTNQDPPGGGHGYEEKYTAQGTESRRRIENALFAAYSNTPFPVRSDSACSIQTLVYEGNGNMTEPSPIENPGPVRVTIRLASPIPRNFTGTIGPTDVTSVTISAERVGSAVLTPEYLAQSGSSTGYPFRITLTDGNVVSWFASTFLYPTDEPCTVVPPPSLSPFAGRRSIAIQTESGIFQDRAFDRCIGTDPLGRSFNTTYVAGSEPPNFAGWSLR